MAVFFDSSIESGVYGQSEKRNSGDFFIVFLKLYLVFTFLVIFFRGTFYVPIRARKKNDSIIHFVNMTR